MKAIIHPSVLMGLIFLFSACMVTGLNGQDQADDNQEITRMARNQTTMPKFDIDFEGGSVVAYVTMLKDIATQSNSGPVNVILDENIQSLKLPAISVSKVPLEAAINVLERIRLNDGRIKVSTSKSIYVITGERWERPTENQRPAAQNSQQAPKKNKPETNVFSVREILSATKERDLLSALEIGLKLSDEETQVEMKLHAETGLLFAKGSKTQLRLIHEVVDNLTRTARDAEREKQQRMMLEMQRNQQQQGNKESSSSSK